MSRALRAVELVDHGAGQRRAPRSRRPGTRIAEHVETISEARYGRRKPSRRTKVRRYGTLTVRRLAAVATLGTKASPMRADFGCRLGPVGWRSAARDDVHQRHGRVGRHMRRRGRRAVARGQPRRSQPGELAPQQPSARPRAGRGSPASFSQPLAPGGMRQRHDVGVAECRNVLPIAAVRLVSPSSRRSASPPTVTTSRGRSSSSSRSRQNSQSACSACVGVRSPRPDARAARVAARHRRAVERRVERLLVELEPAAERLPGAAAPRS